MACKRRCRDNGRLCPKLIFSETVTFVGGVLIINIPAGNYNNNEKYCLVIRDSIPAAATINAPVVITIGIGTVQYPLTECNCRQVTACGIRTRTRYATRVRTTPTGGTFQMLGNPCCSPNNDLRSINGTAPVAEAAVETAAVAEVARKGAK